MRQGPVVGLPQMRHDAQVHTYRVAEAAEVLGVSNDTLRRWIEAKRVDAAPGDDGRTRIAGHELARLAKSLADVGAEAPAAHVRAASVSARNRMRGIVTAVLKDTVMAQVEMVCGPYRMVSLMSAEAATDLGLEPGVLAIASVKSTNVIVELA
jgi:molybdopterin-binding protein